MTTPNVFMLAVDSLRADAVFGDRAATPTMSAYASSGAAFRQCVATCTTTTPSFSSIVTACYPPKHGVRGLHGYRLSESLTTMAESFAAAGYQTHAETTGPLVEETGIWRGFQEARHRVAKTASFFDWSPGVIKALRSKQRPWFVLLHIWEVHRPYRIPTGFAKHNDRSGYEAAVAATDESLVPVFEAAGEDTIVIITGDHGEDYPDSPGELILGGLARRGRRNLKLDKWLPDLDDKLAGLEVGHGFGIFEQLIRVPLIMSGPGIPPAVIDDQVRHVDLFPTLAEICDLEIPAGVHGRSLGTLIEGGTLPEEPAYLEATGLRLQGKRTIGARLPPWKLIKPEKGKPALYRLNGDGPPDEKRNLYGTNTAAQNRLQDYIDLVLASEVVGESGMSSEDEAVVEQHLRDLGYL